MRETLHEPVGVNLVFDSKTKKAVPHHIKWRGRVYTVSQVGLHHTVRRGRNLVHIFSVTDGNMFFRLEFDTETLHWVLEEVSDGLPD